MRNLSLYEEFIRLPPVCTRNSCGWSGMYKKFTNHGETAIQRVIFQVSTLSRNKNIKQRSVELPAPFFRIELDTDVTTTQEVVKFCVITPKTL